MIWLARSRWVTGSTSAGQTTSKDITRSPSLHSVHLQKFRIPGSACLKFISSLILSLNASVTASACVKFTSSLSPSVHARRCWSCSCSCCATLLRCYSCSCSSFCCLSFVFTEFDLPEHIWKAVMEFSSETSSFAIIQCTKST